MKTSLHQNSTPQCPGRPRGIDRRRPTTPSAGAHTRRQFLRMAAGAAGLTMASCKTWAQAYLTRPVRIIVGFPVGGGVDIMARLIGQSLSERLGQQFVIENRPGGGGNIGTEAVVNATPDGHTLLLAFSANAVSATVYERLNFNFIRDIAPVAGIARAAEVVVVHPSVQAKTIPEFIAYAKSNPGEINMGSGGNGTPSHVEGELFKMMTGIEMVHVPYPGLAPALTDLLCGEVQVMFGATTPLIPYIRAGKLRPLAVTSAMRSEALPDIPTGGTFVPGYEASIWYGVGAPRNTPVEIIDLLNEQINAALADPQMKARFAHPGTAVLSGSPADFGKLIADETEKWAKVIKFAGIKVE